MLYYDVTNFVSVIKTTIMDEITCSYGHVRSTGVRIPHEALHRAAQSSAVITAGFGVSHRFVLMPQLVKNVTILFAKYRCIWECSCRVCEHIASLQGGSAVLRITYQQWWGQPECHEGLHVAHGPIYIMLLFRSIWEGLGVLVTSRWARNKISGSTSNCSRAVLGNHHIHWECSKYIWI